MGVHHHLRLYSFLKLYQYGNELDRALRGLYREKKGIVRESIQIAKELFKMVNILHTHQFHSLNRLTDDFYWRGDHTKTRFRSSLQEASICSCSLNA